MRLPPKSIRIRISRKGGLARAVKLSNEELSAQSRHAVNARWARIPFEERRAIMDRVRRGEKSERPA